MSKPKKYTDIYEALEKLEACREYEGSELGEMWGDLISLYHDGDYVSKNLRKALTKEIIDQANWLEKNMELVEIETTIPAYTRKCWALQDK